MTDLLKMSEIPPDTGQASAAMHSGRGETPVRKILEDWSTTLQLQQMMHAISTSQASSGVSAEVNAVNSLIAALSQQIVQLTSELTATKDETIATKNELIATKNEMTTKKELDALKAELTAIIQTQLSSIAVPASASPLYVAVARTPPNNRPTNLPPFSSSRLNHRPWPTRFTTRAIQQEVKEEDKTRRNDGHTASVFVWLAMVIITWLAMILR